MAAYNQSVSTLNLLRAFTKGGFADLSQVHAWNQEFVASSTEGQRFEGIAEGIDRALRFMNACGIDLAARTPSTRSTSGPVMRRSSSTTRKRSPAATRSPTNGTTVRPTCCGWVNGPDSSTAPTVNSSRGSTIRWGPRSVQTPRRPGRRLCARRLNPDRIPGRLTLITRFGVDTSSRPCPAARRGPRRGSSGGVGLRSDARQHLHRRGGPQDPALRRHPRRAHGFFRPTARWGPGPVASMWS